MLNNPFTALDTDYEGIVRIPSPKARGLSAQPAASYSLDAVGGSLELRILDGESFRTVRHIVILTE